MVKIIFIFSLLFFIKAFSGEITLYAASDLIYAFNEIEKLYESKYPKDKIKIIYGSSGKGYNQIVNGAPFDVYFSANMDYVEKLKEQGLVISEIKPYAVGRIVMYTLKGNGIDVNKGINVTLDPKVSKLAIANWEHAPYGKAAKECLEHYNIFGKVKYKLVLGENISQTVQYIILGTADVGFVALSLAKSEKLSKMGNYYLLPESCHGRITQGVAILKNVSSDKEKFKTARRFFTFMFTPETRKIMNKYGFILPGENIE